MPFAVPAMVQLSVYVVFCIAISAVQIFKCKRLFWEDRTVFFCF